MVNVGHVASQACCLYLIQMLFSGQLYPLEMLSGPKSISGNGFDSSYDNHSLNNATSAQKALKLAAGFGKKGLLTLAMIINL